MPITTDTLYKPDRLNLIFAASGLSLLFTVGWMMVEDHNAPWKFHQADFHRNVATLTLVELERYASPDFQRQLAAAAEALASAEESLQANPDYQQHSGEMSENEAQLQGATLKYNDAKAVYDVSKQRYERADTLSGRGSSTYETAKQNLEAQRELLAGRRLTKETLEDKIAKNKADLDKLSEQRDAAQKHHAALLRQREAAETKLSEFERSYVNLIRNNLLDFAAGSVRPKQVVLPYVRSNLNFLDTYQIDRCQSCHIAIDNKEFTQEELVVKLALSIAAVNSGRHYPQTAVATVERGSVVTQDFTLSYGRESSDPAPTTIAPSDGSGVDFSGHVFGEPVAPAAKATPLFGAVVRVSSGGRQLGEARTDLAGRFEIRVVESAAAAEYTIVAAPAEAPLELPFTLPIVKRVGDDESQPAKADYIDQLAHLDEAREQKIRDLWDNLTLVGDDQRKSDIFDAVLVAANAHRESLGQTPLKLEQPLLAHPKLELYVSPDSPHPLKTMGCTSCHGGNGQETSFTTAIHSAATREQEEEWREKYEGRIDYSLAHHFWNRPMLPKKYSEASCAKCHPQVADVARHENRPLATTITLGRQLFTQVGCINCHKVADLDDSRRVGPDLSHIAEKLKPEFVQPWIWYPRDFRPSTWMPHFFKQENNYARSDLPNDPDPDPELRTQTEVAAMSYYLFTFSTPYEPEQIPQDIAAAGDIEAGRQLFDTVGCLGCHAALAHVRPGHQASLGVEWIAADKAHRDGLDPLKAVRQAQGMTYGEQARYALKHLTPERRERMLARRKRVGNALLAARIDGDSATVARLEEELAGIFVPNAFTRFGPELSGIGSKVSIGWLYDWLRNPRHYHSDTKMPRLRLSEKEALDVAAYLTTFKNDEFKQFTFEVDDKRTAMLEQIMKLLLEGQNSQATVERIIDSNGKDRYEKDGDEKDPLTETLVGLLERSFASRGEARRRIEALDWQGKRLAFVGNKMINHYGCYSCHTIAGFEKTTRPGTELTTWSEKSLGQLDFAFFEHLFERDLDESFYKVYPESETFEHLLRDVEQDDAHLTHTHASFGYYKLRNPRIYDRGKVKGPYDKLKMPNYLLSLDQADALTAYLLSRQTPFVTAEIVPDEASHLPAIAAGRNLAAELNCVGCHNIEGNSATVHQYILASAAGAGDTGGGDEEDEEEEEEEEEGGDAPKQLTPEQQARRIIAAGDGEYDEVNGPPWLRGQGAKVQHDWFYNFLLNVEPLRPWLQIRMPSFNLTNEQAAALVQYFAAVSRRESENLAEHLAALDKYMVGKRKEAVMRGDPPPAEGRAYGDEWYREPRYKPTARFLARYAIDNRLLNAVDFRAGLSPEDLREAYASARTQAAFMRDLYDVHYPFVTRSVGAGFDEQRFDLGRQLVINELDCLACHALGDPNVPGANKTPSAPNLSLTYQRLRPEWLNAWMQEPAWIQPGTQMPQWFVDGKTAFVDFGDVRAELEAKYGKTGREQIDLLMEFLYQAGARSYTGVKGGAPEQ